MAVQKKIIDRFDGGISDYERQNRLDMCAIVRHFDIFSNPKKLIPQRATEADENDGSTATGMKQYDVYHPTLGLDGKLYGLGKTAAGYAKVVSKADPTTGNWTLEATAESAAARVTGAFIEWKGDWYMFTGTNKLSKWTIGGTFTDTVLTLAETLKTVAHGVIGADDNLYMFYNNRVVRIAPDGTATDEVLTAIPSDMRITSVCRYGTYLAIACAYGTSATANPAGRSQVFLWDMLTDTTVADVIDWGEGSLNVIANIEERIVGVTDKFMSSNIGVKGGSLIVKVWSGGIPKVYKEIVANQTVTLGRFIRDVVVKNNKMYFVASVPFNDSTATESTFNLGIWAFGRKNKDSDFALTLDYIEEGIDTSNYKINSFGNAGNYWFINHSADGSFTKTDNEANYTFTSIFETQKMGDIEQLQKLLSTFVSTEALPTAGQVTLKYKKEGETTWTTIFTNTVDGSVTHEAINIESSGETLPEFREIQFRIESTGGAEILSHMFKFNSISKGLTD